MGIVDIKIAKWSREYEEIEKLSQKGMDDEAKTKVELLYSKVTQTIKALDRKNKICLIVAIAIVIICLIVGFSGNWIGAVIGIVVTILGYGWLYNNKLGKSINAAEAFKQDVEELRKAL